ncbi:uncharacterized protein [Antennarius striatus]|uniref:uncharacterized protein isoform X1 n=1 Tax=Antennarius striatus TaxID=241820 RepID=UPI0035AF570F
MLKLKSVFFVCIAVLSLTLLTLTYRFDQKFPFWTLNNKTTAHVNNPQGSERPAVASQCAPGQPVLKGQMVSVKGTKTVLMSAYQEHRTGKREVRVIAVVLRSETVAYRCHFCCRGQPHISEGFNNIHSDHFGFKYGTADIMCPIPSSCETPSHIAVTSAEDDPEEESEKEFLEVWNQNPKDSFNYNFVVCVSTMFDFTNVLQLVQSMEMLKLLDVDRVAIYRTSNSPEVQRILDYYKKTGFVEVIPWSLSRFVNVSRDFDPASGPGDLHYFGQIPALNDCVYRYMYRSKYVAQNDIDELILPQAVDSWSELLPLLETKYGADLCYMFENNVFPITANRTPPGSQTLHQESSWTLVPGVNVLAHLYQEPIIPKTFNWNFKIIFNPREVFSPSVHGVLSSKRGCAWIDRSIARMYHTRNPRQLDLTPDQLIYDGRLLSYSDRLTPAVNAVLTESGLLSQDII